MSHFHHLLLEFDKPFTIVYLLVISANGWRLLPPDSQTPEMGQSAQFHFRT